MSIFTFRGRARRFEYWAVNLPIVILSRMSDMIPDDAYENMAVSLGIIILAILMVWIGVATNTRRCHDLGHNGFWQLIPFYGIWMGFVEEESGANEYGPDPAGVAV
jgi:uncharacterized membrane protein YhaH (DUF805 family)